MKQERLQDILYRMKLSPVISKATTMYLDEVKTVTEIETCIAQSIETKIATQVVIPVAEFTDEFIKELEAKYKCHFAHDIIWLKEKSAFLANAKYNNKQNRAEVLYKFIASIAYDNEALDTTKHTYCPTFSMKHDQLTQYKQFIDIYRSNVVQKHIVYQNKLKSVKLLETLIEDAKKKADFEYNALMLKSNINKLGVEKFIEEIQKIERTGQNKYNLDRLVVADSKITMETNLIVIVYRDKYYAMGKVGLNVDMINHKIKCYPVEYNDCGKDYIADNRSYHPHINSENDICLGHTGFDIIKKHFRGAKTEEAIKFLATQIRTYNEYSRFAPLHELYAGYPTLKEAVDNYNPIKVEGNQDE